MRESFAEAFVLSLMVLIFVLSLMVLIFVLSLMVLIFVLSLMVQILCSDFHVSDDVFADTYTGPFLKNSGAGRPPQSQHQYYTRASYVIIMGSSRRSRHSCSACHRRCDATRPRVTRRWDATRLGPKLNGAEASV